MQVNSPALPSQYAVITRQRHHFQTPGKNVLLAAMKEWIVQRRHARRAGMITPVSARERARRGAAYLDDVASGWTSHVDSTSLNLADGESCVLGQLHGSFSLGLGRAGLFSLSSAPRGSFSPVDLGFHCVQGVPDMLQEKDHVNLTRAWREEIARRRPSTRQDLQRRGEEVPAPVLF